jgi:hypothetical protein
MASAALRRRLSQLEARARNRRCHVCRTWPDQRVTVTYDDDGPYSPYAAREPELPAVCPSCGWEPDTVTFRVTYDSPRPGEG